VYQASLFEKYINRPPGEELLGSDSEDAWLGVFTQPLSDDLAEYWSLPANGGVVVSTIVPESPADRAGIRMGDVIFSFNDTTIAAKQDRDVMAFTKLVRESPLEQDILLRIYRNGEVENITLVLTERPKSARDATEHDDEVFGLTVRELTTDVRILLNLPDNLQGVLIRKVESGGAASLAGIPANALVIALNNVPVANIEEYIAAVEQLSEQKPAEIAVLVRAGSRTGFFRMQPRWNN
jgi:serine protease Do